MSREVPGGGGVCHHEEESQHLHRGRRYRHKQTLQSYKPTMGTMEDPRRGHSTSSVSIDTDLGCFSQPLTHSCCSVAAHRSRWLFVLVFSCSSGGMKDVYSKFKNQRSDQLLSQRHAALHDHLKPRPLFSELHEKLTGCQERGKERIRFSRVIIQS